MRIEKGAALHQRDRMGVHLADRPDPLPRERRQHVRDAQQLFARDAQRAAAQQFVVGQQAPGDRVLDRRDAQQLAVGLHAAEQLGKGRAGDRRDPLAGEIGASRRFVETAGLALYGNSFHPLESEKKSRSQTGGIPCYLFLRFAHRPHTVSPAFPVKKKA